MRGRAARGPGQRRRSERWGRWAERAAALHLAARGYRICARNHRTPTGEVDIVARHRWRERDVIVLVEVKARRSVDAALMAVTATARRRIASAGLAWVAKQPDGARLVIRHDVIAVRPWRVPVHVRGAW